MELLKRIWNYRPDKGREAARIKAVRALALFFVFIACATVVSRAADALTVAEVSAQSPRRMSLTHTLEVDGALEPSDSLPVFCPENVTVTGVSVAEGDTVKKGDVLFTFDVSDIQRQARQKSLELTKLELELDEIEQNAKLKSVQGEAALNRAFEDFDTNAESAAFKVKSARDDMNRAKRELREYNRGSDSDEDSGDATYDALRAAYLEKKRLYEEAQMEEQKTLTDVGRKVEDAVPEEYTREKELKQADIEAKQLEIAALQKELAAGGVVLSPADGVVVSLEASPGKRPGGEAALSLATGGVLFAAELTEEQKKEAVRGGKATVTLSGNRKLEDLEMRIRPVADKSGVYRMTAAVPEGESGAFATAKLERKTEAYETCVPLSAVHGSEQDTYVFVVRETETALGLEQAVERIPVDVLDSNESYAAVSGALSLQELVISGNEALSDGDRVRLEKGA